MFKSSFDYTIHYNSYLINYHKPIFYYIGIGCANYSNIIQESSNRQEFPDYVNNYNYDKKVLILIDPAIKTPLVGFNYNLNLIEDQPEYSFYQNNYLDIHVIREYINIVEDKIFITTLVAHVMNTHKNSLIMISNYTGVNWYHLQDEFINFYDISIQNIIRKRFLIDSTYFSDLGCNYDLTDENNQPLIEDGYFYNPTLLTVEEFNKDIKDSKKLRILKNIFKIIKNRYLNDQEYIENRKNGNKKYCIEIVKKILEYIKLSIDMEKIINDLENMDIYNYNSYIDKIEF